MIKTSLANWWLERSQNVIATGFPIWKENSEHFRGTFSISNSKWEIGGSIKNRNERKWGEGRLNDSKLSKTTAKLKILKLILHDIDCGRANTQFDTKRLADCLSIFITWLRALNAAVIAWILDLAKLSKLRYPKSMFGKWEQNEGREIQFSIQEANCLTESNRGFSDPRTRFLEEDSLLSLHSASPRRSLPIDFH